MVQQVAGRSGGEVRPTDQVRKPWSAPVLTVTSIEAVTAKAAKSPSDGIDYDS